MKNTIEEFLLDESQNDLIFNDSFSTSNKLHKEKFDERFIIIYKRSETIGLQKNSYTVAGYFDTKDKIIYNIDYNLNKFFDNNSKIKLSSFEQLEDEICNKVNESINQYVIKNQDSLAKEGKNKHLLLNNYDVKRNIEGVAKKYIKEIEPQIDFDINYNNYNILYDYKVRENDGYIDYLNNRDEYINKISKDMIKNKKEELGFNVLLYRDKKKYLEEIRKNKNGLYNQVHLNRNIYNCLRDLYAKQVNITIKYGDNYLDFKFDFDRLKSSLENGESGTYDYKGGYERVSNFIKNNDKLRKDDRWRSEFEFSHIEKITYGKTELYNKKDYTIEKRQNKEMER